MTLNIHVPLYVAEGFDISEVTPLNIIDDRGALLAAIVGGAPLEPATENDRRLAHIFAAAPDMLSAAVALLKDWDAPDLNDATPIAERFDALRAAVAKAEGRG